MILRATHSVWGSRSLGAILLLVSWFIQKTYVSVDRYHRYDSIPTPLYTCVVCPPSWYEILCLHQDQHIVCASAFSSCWLRMVQQVLCCVVAFRTWFFLIDTQTRIISKRTKFVFPHFRSYPAFVYSVHFVNSFCLPAVISAHYTSGLVLLSGVSRSSISESLSMNYSYLAESRGQAQTLSCFASSCQHVLLVETFSTRISLPPTCLG